MEWYDTGKVSHASSDTGGGGHGCVAGETGKGKAGRTRKDGAGIQTEVAGTGFPPRFQAWSLGPPPPRFDLSLPTSPQSCTRRDH